MDFAPIFSIIIPTYNRPQRLRDCLQSLVDLDYPRDRFEVIVVDDGSPVSIGEVTQVFEPLMSLRLIRQANAGPASARNTGAAAAKGDYLVFTDDDCQPDPSWLRALEAALAGSTDTLVGGHTVNALPENLYSTASQLLIDYIYDYYNRRQQQAMFFASNNFAMPRQVFQELGGFDTNFPLAAGEDREFCDRWNHHKYKMKYEPKARVRHSHHLQLQTFWKQHANYGRGAYHFHRIRARRKSEEIRVEPLQFYWNLLTFPFARKTGHPPVVVAGLLLLSQFANVLGFFREKDTAAV